MLLSHRTYLQCLHRVAISGGSGAFNGIVRESGGHFAGLVGLPLRTGVEGGTGLAGQDDRSDDSGDSVRSEEGRDSYGNTLGQSAGDVKRMWWLRSGLARDVEFPPLRCFNDMQLSVMQVI